MHWTLADTHGAAPLSGAPLLPLEGTGALIAEDTRRIAGSVQAMFRGAPLTLLTERCR
jgi:hypothetical protein